MTILKAENISKQYRLGKVGTGTLRDDLKRWWCRIRGEDDPFLKVGAVNDRSSVAVEDYAWALKDINFEVKHGEVLGIIGKNGAGKSTLLKILSRVTAPTTGSIKTKGRIASLLEIGTGFHPELTGRENIFMNGAVLGMTRQEIKAKLDEIIAFSGCEMYIDTPVKRYSSGMTVRLGFAVAAHLEPEILVVDEVLAVGDAEFQKKAIGKMQALSSGEGRTVLFVSHNMESIKSLCNRTLVLNNGEFVFDGGSAEGVEYYLNEYRSIRKGEVILNDLHRRYRTSKEVEIIKVFFTKNSFGIRDNIFFNVLLRKNISQNINVTLTGTIFSLSGKEVGSFFSENINLSQEETTVNINLKNPNLTAGEYYCNFSVSQGNILSSNLKVIDHGYEVIGFWVHQSSTVNHFVKWEKTWGNIFFDSEIEIFPQKK